MSDFLLDMRERQIRDVSDPLATNLFRYYEDVQTSEFECPEFKLTLSRCDDWGVWGPYENGAEGIYVALCGRIGLNLTEWERAHECLGAGGLACKAIYQKYTKKGVEGLTDLSGHFIVIVFDSRHRKLYLVTDRCGMAPCFMSLLPKGELVFASHPDVLAKVVGVSFDWDFVSMAEFVTTGKLSFPHTYYRKIRAVEFGCIHTFSLREGRANYESKEKVFSFEFYIDDALDEQDIARELAGAFRNSMIRRTYPLFGQTAISLSGGLDSRALLCSLSQGSRPWCFCFYDEENFEYKLAREIANQAGVRFIPLKRNFDHYGDAAESGVRISGGMGSIANNHYLGFRQAFKKLGIQNVIAGFYCDYLFKGLVLNKKVSRFLRRENLGSFEHENYQPFFWSSTRYSEDVRERLDGIFPDDVKEDRSNVGQLNIEAKRLFPLCYEPDNAETLVSERVLPWYLPIVDNDIIDVYLRIPPQSKLNVSMYRKMVRLQCGEVISEIPDANTGAPLNASRFSLLMHTYAKALIGRVRERMHEGLATDGSWPNWKHYMRHSMKIETLWNRPSKLFEDVVEKLLGEPGLAAMGDFKNMDEMLFFRLLTLKLWLQQHG